MNRHLPAPAKCAAHPASDPGRLNHDASAGMMTGRIDFVHHIGLFAEAFEAAFAANPRHEHEW